MAIRARVDVFRKWRVSASRFWWRRPSNWASCASSRSTWSSTTRNQTLCRNSLVVPASRPSTSPTTSINIRGSSWTKCHMMKENSTLRKISLRRYQWLSSCSPSRTCVSLHPSLRRSLSTVTAVVFYLLRGRKWLMQKLMKSSTVMSDNCRLTFRKSSQISLPIKRIQWACLTRELWNKSRPSLLHPNLISLNKAQRNSLKIK